MDTHHFHFNATWPGGRNAVGHIHCGQLHAQVSITASMGGPGEGTNPDEMLLAASATCYLMTLAAMVERAHLPVQAMQLDSDLVVTTDKGCYRCQSITHRPTVGLAAEATDAQMEKLAHLVKQADARCMVSNALRGNVAVTLEPTLTRATG